MEKRNNSIRWYCEIKNVRGFLIFTLFPRQGLHDQIHHKKIKVYKSATCLS